MHRQTHKEKHMKNMRAEPAQVHAHANKHAHADAHAHESASLHLHLHLRWLMREHLHVHTNGFKHTARQTDGHLCMSKYRHKYMYTYISREKFVHAKSRAPLCTYE